MAITGVSPTSGGTGSAVVITGSGFTGATGVFFSSNGEPTLTAELLSTLILKLPPLHQVVLGPFMWRCSFPRSTARISSFARLLGET
jgi:hypothetical protein